MHDDGAPFAGARPVFVDGSGRRGRRIRRLCWVLGTVMALYLATVVLALVGPPGLSRLAVPGLGPVLPGPGAAPLGTVAGGHGPPAKVLRATEASPTASARPTRAALPVANRATPAAAAVSPSPGRQGVGPSPSPTAASAPRPTPSGQGGSPAPQSSKTPRGQASARPSPSNHGKGQSQRPSPSPTP